jgi:hypothetical protein
MTSQRALAPLINLGCAAVAGEASFGTGGDIALTVRCNKQEESYWAGTCTYGTRGERVVGRGRYVGLEKKASVRGGSEKSKRTDQINAQTSQCILFIGVSSLTEKATYEAFMAELGFRIVRMNKAILLT